MLIWFTENILPWLLERLGLIINPDTAEKRGNSMHVILLLTAAVLGFMLMDATQLTFAENAAKVEAVTRLESTKEKIAELEEDVHDLEQENKALLEALAKGPERRHINGPIAADELPEKVITSKPTPKPNKKRDSKDETTAIYQRRMIEQINGR